mmetsp:Transcript_22807/g.23753  ORF Transcript_22807/g.23753 Transcript_22807/m.23753 type:complete len:173 (+) Transcript_22807:2-520(+)
MNSTIYKKNSKHHIDYTIIKPLPFKVIRKNEDGFYNIVNNVVRRSLSWRTEIVNLQQTLFDLGEMVMLSRVHFRDCRIMNIKIEISEKEEGPFIELFKDIMIISGNIRVIKIGNLPCRYFRISVLKGSPIQDFTKMECFGMTMQQMKSVYEEDDMDLLLFSPYNFVYNTNKK